MVHHLERDDRPGVMLTGGPTPTDPTTSGQGFETLDELGCSAIWLTDHLFWGRPMPEALTMCAVAADRTRHAVIGTGVLQLPLRSVAATAKAAASIQMLGDGRFVLGVGVGEHQIEYRLADKEFTRRGRALDDGIAQLRSLWSTGSIDDDDPGPAWFRQRPTPPPIPIWLGGRSQPAIDRTARMGDGWMPIFVTPEQFATATSRLDRALDDAGRDRSEVLRAVTIIAAITDGPSEDRAALAWCGDLWDMPSEPLRTYLVSGPVEAIAESMDAYRSAGAEHISLLLATDDPIAMYQRIVEGGAHR